MPVSIAMIRTLQLIFSLSLGILALWLLVESMTSGRVRRPSPTPRAELFLEILRGGAPFFKTPLERSHYLIGRSPECDILLKGSGMPLYAVELLCDGAQWLFRNRSADNAARLPPADADTGWNPLIPGSAITCGTYSIMIT